MKTFEEIWSEVDKDRVALVIEEEIGLKDYDFEDARLCVYAACEKWLPRDLDEFRISGIEQKVKFTDPHIVTLGGVKGILDLAGTLVGDIKEFAPYAGKKFTLDWKTGGAALDTAWKNRLCLSWQWKIYSAMTDNNLFFYRGIQRPSKTGMNVETREVILEVPEDNFHETFEHLEGLLKSQRALEGYFVWPRNMPDACNTWNKLRTCPFLDDCREYTMPREKVPMKEMSYTRLKTFMECPEKYRREVLLPEGTTEESRVYISFGKAVHRGLAEVYSQVFGVVPGK